MQLAFLDYPDLKVLQDSREKQDLLDIQDPRVLLGSRGTKDLLEYRALLDRLDNKVWLVVLV